VVLTTSDGPRTAFTTSHPDVLLFDASDPQAIERYLLAHELADPTELPARVSGAGEGNMNLTLRVSLRDRSVILKQGRPWVEKYDQIPAPWERTLVEATFYRTVVTVADVVGRMPRLIHVDEHNHVLVLEDLGTAGDYTNEYRDGHMPERDLRELLLWLSALGKVRPSTDHTSRLANRAMRRLNHEHIFSLPLREVNGLALDRITDGLASTAEDLKRDRAYCSRVHELGEVYLSDGPWLVHGDYFPGSWIRTAYGVRIIDPEFCFCGAREFDYGVMLAHCALVRTTRAPAERVMAAARQAQLDEALVRGFAGVEVMRRLIGVAQLPLSYGLDAKRRLLALSRTLVLAPTSALRLWS
jgi:5-methylthioribose kinase